jgi:hypothetical protein
MLAGWDSTETPAPGTTYREIKEIPEVSSAFFNPYKIWGLLRNFMLIFYVNKCMEKMGTLSWRIIYSKDKIISHPVSQGLPDFNV